MSPFLRGAPGTGRRGRRGRERRGELSGGSRGTPASPRLADAAAVQLARPRVCREGCTRWGMRSLGTQSVDQIPGRGRPCSGQCHLWGAAVAGRRHGAGLWGKKCQLTAWLPLSPVVTHFAGNILFPGKLSRNHLFQPMQPKPEESSDICLASKWENLVGRASVAGGRAGLRTSWEP